MACHELAQRIELLRPNASPLEIARLCVVLLHTHTGLDGLETDDQLKQALADANLRLQAALDQHLAVTEELQELVSSDPKNFSPDQIWILVKAIKIQNQLLAFYQEQSSCELT